MCFLPSLIHTTLQTNLLVELQVHVEKQTCRCELYLIAPPTPKKITPQILDSDPDHSAPVRIEILTYAYPPFALIHTKEGMSIRAVIFDFGNVIGFFDHSRAVRRLKEFSRLPEETIYQFLYNGSLEDDFEAGRIGVPQFLTAMREGCRITGGDEDLAAAYADIFTPNTDVCALVSRLKPNYRLVLGSNCTPLHSGRFRDQFAETLVHFDGLALSHEIGARKPLPAFYEACLRLAACSANECLFIDDLQANVEGAQAYGMRGILYRRPDELFAMMRSFGVVV